MGVEIIQTCDFCGLKRVLQNIEGEMNDHWFVLDGGERTDATISTKIEATMCQDCVIAIVHHGLARVSDRARRERGEPSADLIFSFEHLEKARKRTVS